MNRVWKLLSAPAAPILCAVLVQIILVVGVLGFKWHKHRDDPRLGPGEGLVIRGDGLGNYAWLRSLLFDGDWDFANEFDAHNPLGDSLCGPGSRTPLDRRPNPWPVGPALAWAPAILAAHALASGPNAGSADAAHGYTWPYQAGVALGTLLCSWLGLVLLWRATRLVAGPACAGWAVALVMLGTTILFYQSCELSMAHGVACMAVALLTWHWLGTYGSTHPGRWLLAGALVGFAALMRWQLLGLMLLPMGECLLWTLNSLWKDRAALLRCTACLVASCLGAALAFSPQMIAWRAVYGFWFGAPFPLARNWWQPDWQRVLFSSDRGFIYWTPFALLLIVAACAAILVPRTTLASQTAPARVKRAPLFLLAAAFFFQLYALASISGTGVVLGAAYGYRQLTESCVLLTPGLALLLHALPNAGARAFLAASLVCVFWNFNLMLQYCLRLVPVNGGAEVRTLLSNTWELIERLPLVGMAAMTAAAAAFTFVAKVSLRPSPDQVDLGADATGTTRSAAA